VSQESLILYAVQGKKFDLHLYSFRLFVKKGAVREALSVSYYFVIVSTLCQAAHYVGTKNIAVSCFVWDLY
jgi:hypothetical protein